MRNNEIFLFSQPRPIRSAHNSEGWTPETVAERVFPMFANDFYPLQPFRGHFHLGPRLTMALRDDLLLAHVFPEQRQRFSRRDAILYALGVGLGRDPLDAADLAFLLEDRLIVLPTFAVTLGSPGMWIKAPQFEADLAQAVALRAVRAFSCAAAAGGGDRQPRPRRLGHRSRRGPGRDRRGGARDPRRDVGDALLRLGQTLLLRADGGFGGPRAPQTPSVLPARPRRARASRPTLARR